MKSLAAIVIVLFSSASLANERARINEVWIDGSTFYASIKHSKNSTLYFKKWSPYVQQYLQDPNYFVALQLDDTFDPLPSDKVDLPDLQVVSSISDETLLEEYLDFFVNLNRTQGISHLILPDTNHLNIYEREVIKRAANVHPYFFLYSSLFSYDLPESKKEFAEKADARKIYVARQDVDTRKLERWSQRFVQNLNDPFLRSIRDYKQSSFSPTSQFPPALNQQLFEATVIAIDPNLSFPLTDKYLTYLGDDPALRSELSKYFYLVPHRIPEIKTLVDLRKKDYSLSSGDLLISDHYTSDHTSLIVSHDVANSSTAICEMLIGAKEIKGRSKYAYSRSIPNFDFLTYSHKPLSQKITQDIDSMVAAAIRKYATPGAQIAVIKGKEIIYEKSYGYYTYDSLKEISKYTLYDLASLTKVTSTLPAIAWLIDHGDIHLDDPISKHLRMFRNSNKSDITIRQLLAHNGGLKAYVPFWKMALEGDRLDAFYYKNTQDEQEDIRSYGFQPDPILLDTLKSYLINSDLTTKPKNYQYSDLGFMILHMIVEEVSGLPFDQFLYEKFYRPMALHYTWFNPLENGFDYEDIAPTEYDSRYRSYQVWGEVHDRNALVFGGDAGHAGLFSNATDVARLMSMFLNQGYYGGQQYIQPQTLYSFNRRYFDANRRGLGWDKKDAKKERIASNLASDQSFGHSGFSGTFVWVDPKYELVFVFLSNRIYPDSQNWKLNELNTRTNIHRALYESLPNDNETYIGRD